MPLFKTIHVNDQTTIYLWKIEESFDELRDINLNTRSVERVNGMRSELHRKGFLSVRHLLKTAGYSDEALFYSEDGKPHLKNGRNISITHSFNFSAIIISTTEVGIDIEKNRDKIKRIAHKFIDKENTYLEENQLVEQLTVIWGAKESLYKIHPDGGLLFREHLPIEAFILEDKKTVGWIKKEPFHESYQIYFEQIEDFTLVYAIN